MSWNSTITLGPRAPLGATYYLGRYVAEQAEQDGAVADVEAGGEADAEVEHAGDEDEQQGVDVDGEDNLLEEMGTRCSQH